MAKFLRLLTGLFLSAFLAGCGGGGGSAGNSGNGAVLFTTAPSSINVLPGETRAYTVGGGTPGYSAASSSSALKVSIIDKTLTIVGVGSGSATITVTDNAGAKITISVTIGTGVALNTNAPATVNVAISKTSSVFLIQGGSTIYTVTTSDKSIADVTTVGTDQFFITGISNGNAVITVTDSLGALVKIGVVVGNGGSGGSGGGTSTPLTTTAAASITIGTSRSTVETIIGGTAPYFASSSNSSVSSATVAGNQLTITGVAIGSSSVKVLDSAGQSVTIAVQVGSSSALFTSAPKDVTVGVGATSATFTIGGGSQVYAVVSANTQVATVGINGNTFIINGVKTGTTTVNVSDTSGATVAINVTVTGSGSSATLYTTAPSAITVATGSSSSYQIAGGLAPYSAESSNKIVSNAVVSGNVLSISGDSAGSAKVKLTDAAGSTLTIDVTVAGGSTNALFTTAPAAVTVAIKEAASYGISGGVAPYTVTSSATSIALATLDPVTNKFTVTGVAAGAATVLVTDSAGKAVSIAVTVNGSVGISLYTTAPAAVTLSTGTTVQYTIGGGVSPYTVVSSNAAVAAIPGGPTTTSSFSVQALTPGAANVVISDAVGAKLAPIAVTVSPQAVVALSVSPNNATGAVGDTLSFQISGGTPSYTVTSTNTSIAAITSPPNAAGIFTVRLANAGQTTVNIVDTQGAVTSMVLTVTQNSSLLRLSPSVLEVAEDFSSDFNLTIYGGTGPYKAFTSDLKLSDVSIVSTATPQTFLVKVGTNASRCINPVDSSNKYIVNGTYNVTFTVVDSLGASATAVMTIRDNGKGLSFTGC